MVVVARNVESDLTSGVVLVTSAEGERRDVMPATQVVLLSYAPALLGVAITPSHLTHELITSSGEFAVNVLTKSQLELVRRIGHSKGREIDKFSAFDVPVSQPSRVGAPLISGCRAAMECRVAQVVPVGDHDLVVGEVLVHHRFSSEPPLVLSEGRLK